MINAIISYDFMQNAIVASILASILCGIIGTIIVEKKLVSMSGGIAHTSFGGIGLGYLLNIPPIITGMIVAVLASVAIPTIQRKTKSNADTLVGVFWATGMAFGILFIGLTPGYPPDMTSYLFGDILTISRIYVVLIGLLAVFSIIVMYLMFEFWKAYLFDEDYLKILGMNIGVAEKGLFILIALSIVIMIKVVGMILAIALFTLPAATIKLYTSKLKNIMIISSVYSLVSCLIGLSLSYYLNIPSGATIILLLASGYVVSYFKTKKKEILIDFL